MPMNIKKILLLSISVLICVILIYLNNKAIKNLYLNLISINNPSLKMIRSNFIPSHPEKGQIWVKDKGKTICWFNGQYWHILKDEDSKYKDLIHIKMKIRFNKSSEGISEPLLTTGRPGTGDFIYVTYLPRNQVSFALDHWGGGGKQSEPLFIDPKDSYLLEIKLGNNLDPKNYIKLDGRLILEHDLVCYPTLDEEITIGRNKIGGTSCSSKFSGEIKQVERIELLG